LTLAVSTKLLAVAPLGVSLNSHALRPITNGFIALSAALLSIGKKTSLHVAIQPAPVAGQIIHCFAQYALWCHLRLRLLQPAFQLGQDRQALFLTANKTLLITGILEFTLDAVQLVDQGQRDIGTSRLAFGLYFLRLDKLASRMGPEPKRSTPACAPKALQPA
jgi:hypothetical protein